MSTEPEYREEGFFVVTLGERRYRVPRHCPHRAGRLDHGDVDVQGERIVCPLHRSSFSLQDGRQLSGPACGSLAVCTLD